MKNAFEAVSLELTARGYKQALCPEGRIIYGMSDCASKKFSASDLHFTPKSFWDRFQKPDVFLDTAEGNLYIESILNSMFPLAAIPDVLWDKIPVSDFLQAVDKFCGKVKPSRPLRPSILSRLHL